jgi:hypothetical protein
LLLVMAVVKFSSCWREWRDSLLVGKAVFPGV